jgi:hypothetical protein
MPRFEHLRIRTGGRWVGRLLTELIDIYELALPHQYGAHSFDRSAKLSWRLV